MTVDIVDSELLGAGDEPSWARVKAADAILVPGGFGDRGTRGKIDVIAYARQAGGGPSHLALPLPRTLPLPHTPTAAATRSA